jgi:hypothetical protein
MNNIHRDCEITALVFIQGEPYSGPLGWFSLEEDAMKAWALMLAVVPLLPPDPVAPREAAAGAIAIVIDVRAPLAWGKTEWRLFTREVEEPRASYVVTFCWVYGPGRCEGLEVRVRVLFAIGPTSAGTTMPLLPPV